MASTRKQRMAQARKLRVQGLTYQAISERVGVSRETVYRWLNPDYARRHLASGRDWKERHRDQHTCKRCGAPRRGYEAGYDHCAECARELLNERTSKQVKARVRKMLALRRRGFLNHEIAEQLGTTSAGVATLLQRSSVTRLGFEYVPSPYNANRRRFQQAA